MALYQDALNIAARFKLCQHNPAVKLRVFSNPPSNKNSMLMS